MSELVGKNSSEQFVIASGDKLAIFSQAPVKVYQLKTFLNHPDQWSLLKIVEKNTEYTSSAFSADTTIEIEAKYADVFYETGTAPVIIERRGLRGQGTPGVLNSTGTVTPAMILSGILTSTAAAGTTATLSTGAVMDAAINMDIGDSVDWAVIDTGAAATITITAAASGHTVVGTGAVLKSTSGLFRTRKTAAATYVTYRIG